MSVIKSLAICYIIVLSSIRSFAGAAYGARTMESVLLGRTIEYSLIIPMDYLRVPDSRYPVLFGLHGHGANYEAYTSMQTIKDAVETDPMLVVAFNAGNNYYVDVTEFFFDEFIPYIDSLFRTNGEYAVTGFSMGGFGAFHFMMTDTDLFKSVSTKSAAFYSSGVPTGSELNPRISAAAKAGTELPPIYMDCGTADSWISNQREMRDTLTSLGYTHEYHETPGAEHDWTFWSAAMTPIIAFHGSHFDYPSGVGDRSAGVIPPENISATPNPSYGILKISGFNGHAITIFRPDGRVAGTVSVRQGQVDWKQDLPGLTDGVYFIGDESNTFRVKVMLVR